MQTNFIEYQPPSTRNLLVLGSFLFFLPAVGLALDVLIRCGLIGQMLLGAIYGAPLANILPTDWQEAFLAIGYLALILLVFEGGLSTDMSLLTRNLSLSIICALTGIIVPIALSILWLTQVFRYTVVQSFVAGASLSATSLGTTIAILRASDSKPRKSLFQSAIATVLMTAAIFDDVVGLITASIISGLGGKHHESVGWVIGRPVLASGGLILVAFVVAQALGYLPLHRYCKSTFLRHHKHRVGISLMVGCLVGVATAAAYAGTSILFGAFVAGLLFSYANSGPEETRPIDFHKILQETLGVLQEYLLLPLFFASIGFSIPFRDLWRGSIIWRGIVYSIIMMLGKMVVGIWVPIWSLLRSRRKKGTHLTEEIGMSDVAEVKDKSMQYAGFLLGAGMVARGEIGLLICQVGFNGGDGILPDDLFAITIWALVLNTIVGPLLVAFCLRRWETHIRAGEWGNASPTVDVRGSEDVSITISPP